MKKKLIGFEDEMLGQIEEYSDKYGMTFTEAVRTLIEVGLVERMHDSINKEQEQGDSVDLPSLVHIVDELSQQIEKLAKDMSWWNADESESKVGNLKVKLDDMEKKINVLTSVSKLFKGHLKDRSIHLQD